MSRLKTDAIRNTSASADALTFDTNGHVTAPGNLTVSGTTTISGYHPTTSRSNKNLIINGAMNVAQRGTSENTTTGMYTVDRFRVEASGHDQSPDQAQHALTSSDTGPWEKGFRSSWLITNGNQTSGAGAADSLYLDYRLEAQDLANSGWNYNSTSSKMTLSFWAKSSVAQTFSFWIWTADGTSQGWFTTYTLAANTWKKITITLPGAANLTFDNNANIGFQLGWDLFMGTDHTNASATVDQWINWSGAKRAVGGSTWWTTNDATFEMTGVQLEVGDTATDFEHRSYGDELTRCQRYLEKIQIHASEIFMIGTNQWGSRTPLILPFKSQKRAVPSCTIDASSFDRYAIEDGSNGTVTGTAAAYTTDGMAVTFAALDNSSLYWANKTATGYVLGDAEL